MRRSDEDVLAAALPLLQVIEEIELAGGTVLVLLKPFLIELRILRPLKLIGLGC